LTVAHRATALAGLTVLLALALGAGLLVHRDAVRAQEGPLRQVRASIRTDRTQYTIGDTISYCYTVPGPGPITILNTLPDRSPRVVLQGVDDGTGGCRTETATGPAGTQCLQLQYSAGGGGQVQDCFQVIGGGPPPPPPPSGSITTNQNAYTVGQIAQICYRVPGPGSVTILDTLANGVQQTFFQGYDDGTGACLPGQVTPPTGTECLTLVLGGATIGQTCFQVLGGPTPPSGWTVVGAQVVNSSFWNFDTQAFVGQGVTRMRVTSGGCDDSSLQVYVWEAQLEPTPTPGVGTTVYSGTLLPVGPPATGSGGGGHARIVQPVVPNPQSQVDATMVNMQAVIGQVLTVCLGAP
jgi:hypothetical protein